MSLLSWTAQAAWERTSSSLLQESCPNGYYDPGETNQVQFTIKNTSGGDLEEVQVELLPDGASLGGGQAVTGSNVDFVLTAKTDKQTVTKDSSISPTFTFRIKGNCGRNSFVHPLLLITWKNGGFEYVNFVGDKLAHNGQLGATVQTPYSFTSNAPITINDRGNADHPGTATPYPASINASGVPNNLTDDTGERIVNVAVTLKNVTHPTQTEVGALLVGPRGQKVVLFRSAGNPVGGFINTTFTISGFGSSAVPLNAPIQDTATYNSADYGSGSFFGSAPAAPYNQSLDVFKSTPASPSDPNGAWNLYIIDGINNGGGTSGAVAGGWTLTLTTEKIVCCNGGETTPSITQYRDGRPNPNIAEVTIPEDTIFNSDEVHTGQTKSPLVSFEVSDLQTDPDNISVSGVSGDETKIKSSNIKIATTTETANGIIVANRTMEFRTEPNANGSVPVTIVATDASGRSSSATFNLKINSINDLPTFPNPVRNQAVNVGNPTPPLPFTVADAETPADQLVLTATSLDQNVVPNANIVLTGNGANWTVTVIPVTTGSARIKITATDKDGGVGRMGPDHTDGDYSFRVDFTTPANYPTISPFDPLTTKEDESKSVAFTLRSGSSTPVDSLVVTVSSSNPSLIPVGNIAITGSGTERTLTVTPVANINSYTPDGLLGNTSTITLTATDSGRASSQSFVFTVTPVNDKPTITVIPAQIIPEDSETAVIAFKVFDVETPNGQLTVAGRSSNPGLVPTPNVTINGKVYGVIVTQGLNAEDRNVKIVPLPNAFGRATIFLDVTDIASQGVGPDTTVGSFPLEVQPVNDAPSINTINGNPLATNSDDAPLVKGDITEDTGVTDADHIAAQTLVLGAPVDDAAGGGIYPGVKPSLGPLNEVEQTVTLSATLDSTSIISSVFFDPADDAKVKYPKTQTNLRYKLVPNAYGEVTVTLTLTDNGTGGLGGDSLSTVRKFKLRVNPANDAPSLKATPPTANLAHGQAIVVPIEVKDIETAAKNMTITATSTDPSTVPVANIIADPGQGIVTIIPIAPQDLSDRDVTISLAATDRGPKDDGTGELLTTSPSQANGTIFTLHFRNLPINHPPVLSDLSPNTATIQEDGVATSNVTISDPDGSGDVNGAVLSATSSDANILPGSNVLFGGTGANRSIAFVPNKDKNGSVTLSIVATDPGGFSSVAKKFDLTIVAVEDAPTVAVTRSTGDNTPWSGSVISANEDVSVVPDVKTTSGLIEVKVADAETPADQLVVEATSNNQNLVPNANITVSPTGGTRTLSIKPVANRSGDAVITVKVKDANGTKVNGDYPLDTFTVRINQVNDAPTLNNPVPSLTTVVAKNAPPQSLSLTGITAGPEEGGQATNPSVPAQILTLKATAINKGSNPDDHKNDFMIPISGTDVIQAVFSGTGSATATATTEALTGLLTFQPKPNVFGTSTITVTVTDNGGTDRGGVNSTKIQFDVVIGDVNTAPTITIPSTYLDLTIPPGSTSGVIPITVTDASNETPANELKLSFVSSNPALVPNSPESFTETGSGSNRGVIVKPLANAFGSANITVTVTDKGKADGSDVKSASQTLKLSVAAGPNPVVSPIADVTTHVNQDTDIIPFTVTDAQTPAELLVINATSDNQAVVPDFNIQFGGSGSNRALIIRPAQDRSGVATIRVTARDADNNIGFTTFKLNVLGQAPTISTIPDKLNLPTGGSTGALPFTVSDKETFAGFLVVTASSSNKNLVPDANIFLGGSGETRTVNVALAPGLTGNSTITLTVKDGEGQTATSSFKVGTTAAANTPPTISSIANVNIKVGDNIPIIGFTVGDVETAPADLKTTAVSSNPALISSSGIFLGGTGAARSLLLNPVKDKTGSTTITVTVADGGGATTSTGFTVTVSSVAPVGVKNDFNGDGTQDIILQDSGGFLAAWYMSGDDVLSTSFLTPNNVGDLGWKVVGAGDFDNDSKTDLLFQHTDGSLAVWKLNGVNLSASVLLNPANAGAGWKAVATGDFNKDGKVDILFQHTDGTLAVWYMDGINLAAVAPLNPNNAGPGWTVVGTGDINGDTNLDVVFQHTDGSLAVWYLTGNVNLLLPALLTPSNPGDQNWRAVGTIDLNGDKKTDILFQNRADNSIAVWYMNQATLVLGKLLNPSNPGGTWQVVAP